MEAGSAPTKWLATEAAEAESETTVPFTASLTNETRKSSIGANEQFVIFEKADLMNEPAMDTVEAAAAATTESPMEDEEARTAAFDRLDDLQKTSIP